MKRTLCVSVTGMLLATSSAAWAGPPAPKNVVKEPTTMPASAADKQDTSPLSFVVKSIDGKDQDLSQYKGKVVLIVNVASKCGFTPQYTALEKLYKQYADKGFVILGFPANDFGHQEPGSNEQILEFCTSKFDVTFPMMAKISVKGTDKAPLYQYLTEKSGDFADEIGWNFTKFLVDRNGNLIARYASQTKPDDPMVTGEIEKALAAAPAQTAKG